MQISSNSELNRGPRLTGEGTHAPWAFRLFTLALPLLWGWRAVLIGQDIDGDQLYYHFYGAASVLNGRFLRDISAGGLSGFNNPSLYFPFVLAVTYLPAKLIGFLIGCFQGLNLALIVLIGTRLFRPVERWTWILCVLTAVYVATSPLFIMLTGRTFGDDWVSVVFLLGVWFLLEVNPVGWRLLVGGFLLGTAAGLKITNIPMAFVFGVAFSFAYPSPRKILLASAAVMLGFFFTAGWWAILMYSKFGNPLFPYYNKFFKSPLFPTHNFHDDRWKLLHLRDVFKLPFDMAHGTTSVIEATYQSTHWLIFFALVLVAFGFRFVGRGASERWYFDRRKVIVPLFCILAFLIWSFMLHYLRYLIVAECCIAVGIAQALRSILKSDKHAVAMLAVFIVLSISIDRYLPDAWSRIPASGRWYHIPPLDIPVGSTVILGNDIGFIEQALPKDSTIIGLGTNYFDVGTPIDSATPATMTRIRKALLASPGHVYLLTLKSLPERFDQRRTIGQLGLEIVPNDCHGMSTNVGQLNVCHLAADSALP